MELDLTQRWQVIHGDAISLLRAMPDGAVDCIVTDPPYGLGFPYLSYDDTRDNLTNLIAEAMPEARRVARRVFVLCGPTQIGLYPQPDWVSNVTWNTTGTFGRYGYNQWTPVLCYGDDLKGFGSINGLLKSDTMRISGGAGVGFQRSAEEKKHTCPKPLTVMDMVIRRMTRPDDRVLDPLCGSGTTGVSCVRHGRAFVGFEKEATYCDIARRRIRDASLALFEPPAPRVPEPTLIGEPA